MALVALASIKGAPGVTTAALALGAVWPDARPVVVVEVDPAGGDVTARRGLQLEPSIVTLAAAVRRAPGGQARLLDHCHELAGGLHVLAGSSAPTEMRSAGELVSDALPTLARDGGVDVIADCGRLESAGPSSPSGSGHVGATSGSSVRRLLARADMVIVTTHAELADLSHVEAWLPTIRSITENLALLLVGQLRWRAEEIQAELGVPVYGHLPHDPVGAEIVGGRARKGSVARLPLMRAATSVVERIAERLPVLVPEPIEATPTTSERQAVVATGEAPA